jgi:hypothetical protein
MVSTKAAHALQFLLIVLMIHICLHVAYLHATENWLTALLLLLLLLLLLPLRAQTATVR